MSLSAIATADSGRRLATGDSAGTLRIYDIEVRRPGQKILGPFHNWQNIAPDAPLCTAAHPNADSIAIGHRGGWLAVADVDSGMGIDAFPMPVKAPIRSLKFSPDGEWLACGVAGKKASGVYVFRVLPNQRLQHADPSSDAAPEEALAFVSVSGLMRMTYSPDHRMLATGSRSGQVSLINTESWETVENWHGHDGGVYALAFCGQQLVTGGSDGVLRCWDVSTFRQTRAWPAHDQRIYSICVAPDQQRIYSASQDGTVGIWSREGQLLHRITEHATAVLTLAISPDGQTLATGGRDQLLELHDAVTGDSQLRLETHAATIHSVQFTRYGITSTSQDMTTRVWGYQPPQLKSESWRN